MHIYPRQTDPTPPPIDYRSMEDQYTSADRPHPQLHQITFIYSRMHIYPWQTDPPPPIDHRSMEDHYTDSVSHIAECTDTSADRPHPLLQSTIYLWKTTTLTQFHIQKNAQIPDQTDPTPPPIDHRSMEDQYTSADRTHPPLLQLTTDLCNTTIPNKFYI